MERDKREFIVTIVGLVLFASAMSYFSDDLHGGNAYVGESSPTAHAVDVPLEEAPREEKREIIPPRKTLVPGGRFGPPLGNGTNMTANHTECRHRACVTVPGPGRNQCRTNRDCRHPHPSDRLDRILNRTNMTGNITNITTHLVCQGLACVSVAGAGVNQCISSLDCNISAFRNWTVFLTWNKVSGGINNSNATAGTPFVRGDRICNLEAPTRGLPGRYVAWLSTSYLDARERIVPGIYKSIYGQTIATSRVDLLDGSLQNPIDPFRGGWPPNDWTWTGTSFEGKYLSHYAEPNCKDWTSIARLESAAIGNPGATNGAWTDGAGSSCDQLRNLYCFQVA